MTIPNLITFIILTAVVIVAAVIDCRTQKIPNRLTYSAILAGLVLAVLLPLIFSGGGGDAALAGLKHSAIATLVAFIPFTIIFAMGALGGGDVKLMTAVGAISASWHTVFATAIYAFIAIFIIAVVVMFKNRIAKRTFLRIFHATFAIFMRNRPTMPTDSPRLPMGLAIAIGAIIAGTETLLGMTWPWTSSIYP